MLYLYLELISIEDRTGRNIYIQQPYKEWH